MKKAVLAILIMFLLSLNSYCDEMIVSDSDTTHKKFTIGLINNYTDIDNKISSTIGLSAGYQFHKYFEIGISANGIWYDYRLDELDPLMTYHLESGYSGLYLKSKFNLTPRIEADLSLFTGMGLIQLKYDNKYREQLKWDEEIIDRESYAISELSFGIGYLINKNWKVGFNASLRNTSEIYIDTMEEDMLNNFNLGFAFEYSIF